MPLRLSQDATQAKFKVSATQAKSRCHSGQVGMVPLRQNKFESLQNARAHANMQAEFKYNYYVSVCAVSLALATNIEDKDWPPLQTL